MLSADDYPLAQVVETAYAQADRLVFEISPDLADSPGMGAQMVQRAMLPAAPELADVLSEDTVHQLPIHTGNEAAYAATARFKPAFITIGLELRAMQGAGLGPARGLHQNFRRRYHSASQAASGRGGSRGKT